jgi:AraC family ethanolamine operon transcriptional activator
MQPNNDTVATRPLYHWSPFQDHDELSSLIQGGDSEFIQRERGAFEGDFTFVGMDAGTVQFGYIKLPYIGKGVSRVNRAGFLLRLDMRGEWIWRGQSMDRRSIVYLAPGAEYQDISPGGSTWAFLSFDWKPLERALGAFTGTDFTMAPQGCRLFLPEEDSFETLRRRLKAVQAAVRTDPSLLQESGARHGMEESVLSVLALALGSAAQIRPVTYGAPARARVLRHVEACLEARKGETVYLADLCAVTGVSERTLRTVFQESYGMSPVQYLKLRRLHQVRRALRRADSDLNTVQSVANSFGIWHLGRFAVEYRKLFGEPPLETLKQVQPGAGSKGALLLPALHPRSDFSIPEA